MRKINVDRWRWLDKIFTAVGRRRSHLEKRRKSFTITSPNPPCAQHGSTSPLVRRTFCNGAGQLLSAFIISTCEPSGADLDFGRIVPPAASRRTCRAAASVSPTGHEGVAQVAGTAHEHEAAHATGLRGISGQRRCSQTWAISGSPDRRRDRRGRVRRCLERCPSRCPAPWRSGTSPSRRLRLPSTPNWPWS